MFCGKVWGGCLIEVVFCWMIYLRLNDFWFKLIFVILVDEDGFWFFLFCWMDICWSRWLCEINELFVNYEEKVLEELNCC